MEDIRPGDSGDNATMLRWARNVNQKQKTIKLIIVCILAIIILISNVL